MKVYPQPKDLIAIYDKTVPRVLSPFHYLAESADPSHQHVLDLLAEMLAVDRTVIADEDDDDDDDDDDEHILE